MTTTEDSAIFFNDTTVEPNVEIPVNKLEDTIIVASDEFGGNGVPHGNPIPPGFVDYFVGATEKKIMGIVKHLDTNGGEGGSAAGGAAADGRPPYDAEIDESIPSTVTLAAPTSSTTSVNIGNSFDINKGDVTNWGSVTTEANRVAAFQLTDDSYLRVLLTISVSIVDTSPSDPAKQPVDISLRFALGVTSLPETNLDLRLDTNWTFLTPKHTYLVNQRSIEQATSRTFMWSLPAPFVSTITGTNENAIVSIFAFADSTSNIFTEEQTLTIKSKFVMF